MCRQKPQTALGSLCVSLHVVRVIYSLLWQFVLLHIWKRQELLLPQLHTGSHVRTKQGSQIEVGEDVSPVDGASNVKAVCICTHYRGNWDNCSDGEARDGETGSTTECVGFFFQTEITASSATVHLERKTRQPAVSNTLHSVAKEYDPFTESVKGRDHFHFQDAVRKDAGNMQLSQNICDFLHGLHVHEKQPAPSVLSQGLMQTMQPKVEAEAPEGIFNIKQKQKEITAAVIRHLCLCETC